MTNVIKASSQPPEVRDPSEIFTMGHAHPLRRSSILSLFPSFVLARPTSFPAYVFIYTVKKLFRISE